MSTYRGTADRPEQAKAIAGVAAVHVALAFVILTGLNVRTVRQAVERLTTVNIVEPPPPPPVQPPPKPAPKPEAMKKPQGAAARKAEPTPVVAPQPKLPYALANSGSQGRRHRQQREVGRRCVWDRHGRWRRRQRPGRRRRLRWLHAGPASDPHSRPRVRPLAAPASDPAALA